MNVKSIHRLADLHLGRRYLAVRQGAMKVLMVNSSPHKQGTTSVALDQIESALNENDKNDIEVERWWLGTKAMQDCIACHKCSVLGHCVFNDIVVDFAKAAHDADGFVFASPVYYAHPTGRLLSFMDRAFYSDQSAFAFKPAAAVFAARRAGQEPSMDVVNKYFTIASMPVVSSTYWNSIYGQNADQAKQDVEGMAVMRNIGLNMAWMLKCIQAGKEAGIDHPENPTPRMNFIR